MAGDVAVGRPKIGRYLCSCVDEEIADKTIGSEGRYPSVVGTLARERTILSYQLFKRSLSKNLKEPLDA